MDVLLTSKYCKKLETPRYTNSDILVFRNGVFYNYVTCKFYKHNYKKGKTYTTIYVKNNSGTYTTMIIPYIICVLFRDDYIKHESNQQNHFEYIDGNPDNCDADNIRANYYEYNTIKEFDEKVLVDICGYEVLLNKEFVINELHKHNLRPCKNGQCIYFSSENTGEKIKLHHSVRRYYFPDEILTGVIDHQNHNTLDNTIENLNPIHHIINSMNNMNIKPLWDEKNQKWSVRYVVDRKGYSKSFSVFKYKTKERAYDEALKYIADRAVPHKAKLVKNKEINLKIKEFDELVKYFIRNNMSYKITEILKENSFSTALCVM